MIGYVKMVCMTIVLAMTGLLSQKASAEESGYSRILREAKEEGFTVVEDLPASQLDIRFFPYLYYTSSSYPFYQTSDQSGVRSSGRWMYKRAREWGCNLGLRDAGFYLDHQDKLPPEWKGGIIAFPGAVLKHSNGFYYIAYIHYILDRGTPHSAASWEIGFRYIDQNWHSIATRLVCPNL